MKKALALALAASMAVACVACGGSASTSTAASTPASTSGGDTATADAPTEKASIKFGNTQSETELQSQALLAVADKLSEATDGNFTAECYFSSSLGDTDDMIEQALQGAAILTVTDPSRLASYVPDFGILAMPYLMDSYDDLNKVVKTDQYQEWVDEFADQHGLWLVTSNWASGERNFCLNKVVNTPEDLAGQRIRTIGNDICTSSVNNMGAVATPMSWNEVYTAIQQGALDGAEVQTSSFYATRLWEVVNTINRTRHFLLVGCAATGTSFRDSLSADYQQLFLDTFYNVGEDFQATNDATCEAWEQEMVEKYGMTINEDVDVEAFKAAADKTYDELGMTELRDRIQAEIKG